MHGITAVGSAGSYQHLVSVYPAAELTAGSGTHNLPTARCDLPFSGAFCIAQAQAFTH